MVNAVTSALGSFRRTIRATIPLHFVRHLIHVTIRTLEDSRAAILIRFEADLNDRVR